MKLLFGIIIGGMLVICTPEVKSLFIETGFRYRLVEIIRNIE